MSDGTEFQIDVAVSSSSVSQVEALANKAITLAEQLAGAGAAATAAAAAVKAGEAAYKQAESGADRAAKAVEKLGIKADEQRAKLAKLAEGKDGVVNIAAYQRAQAVLEQLGQRQVEAAQKADVAKAALASEAASLDKLRAASEAAQVSEAKLVQAHAEASAAVKQAAAVEAAAAKERASVAASAAKAQVAAEQAAAKEAASAAKAQQAAAQKEADAAKLAASGTGKVNEMAEAFNKLGGPVGMLGGKVFGAAEGFKKLLGSMGGAGVYAAIAVAVAAIVAGVVALSAALTVAIGSVLKWSITLSDKNKDIDKQTTRLKSNIDKMFSGLKLTGLIGGLSKIADLFEENSVSAKAIKVVFESLFQPLVDGITAFIPKMITAFIQFEILVLKALIAIKPFGSTIVKVGEVLGVVALIVAGVVTAAVVGLVAGFTTMALAAGVVISAIAAVAAGVVWLGAQLSLLLVQLVNGAVGAFNGFKETVQSAIDWLSSLSLAEIGAQLIQGLVNGITGAGGGVLSAVTGVATGAIDAAKKALGIASPSKVFAEIGGYTAEGMAGGVDAGAPAVQGSMEDMIEPPAPAAAPASASTSSGGGGITIENLVIQAKTDDPQSFADAFRGYIADLRAQRGLAVPA